MGEGVPERAVVLPGEAAAGQRPHGVLGALAQQGVGVARGVGPHVRDDLGQRLEALG